MKELIKDIYKLYLKTGRSDVEDLFIKLSTTNFFDFSNWIIKDQTIRKLSRIISDKNTLQSLIYLIKLNDSYSAGISRDKVFPILNNSNGLTYLHHILMIKENMHSFSFLMQMQNLLSSFEHFEVKSPSVSKDQVLNDLNKIDLLYLEETRAREELESGSEKTKDIKSRRIKKALTQIENFKYLITRFSNELSEEANNKNMKELSNALKQGNIIYPSIIKEYIYIYDYLRPKREFIKKLIIQVLKQSNTEANYDFIKTQILLTTNKLPLYDPNHPIQKMHRSVSDLLKEDGKKIEETESVINDNSIFITNDNTLPLSYLTYFFHDYSMEIVKIKDKLSSGEII